MRLFRVARLTHLVNQVTSRIARCASFSEPDTKMLQVHICQVPDRHRAVCGQKTDTFYKVRPGRISPKLQHLVSIDLVQISLQIFLSRRQSPDVSSRLLIIPFACLDIFSVDLGNPVFSEIRYSPAEVPDVRILHWADTRFPLELHRLWQGVKIVPFCPFYSLDLEAVCQCGIYLTIPY
ncbi:unnamed protein product [Mycena citricolor]|uniref:Uncharacterized protein n=1 Tax=Mycena citricolor TaxID=2018698 RepID=A0AAD2H2T3_9AGAR|nr:unnamed protein product [Mycena citricolor]